MDSAQRLLVLDYPGRRVESRIGDLDLPAAGWRVEDLLAGPLTRQLHARDFAARLDERRGPFGADVTAILAYCSAAPIAQELAMLMGARRRAAVPLLLFDGEPSPPENLTRDFGYAAADLCGVSTVDAVPGGVATLTSAALSAQPARCVELMRARLVELATAAFHADGADVAEAAEAGAASAELYLDWLVYLVAAHNTSWPDWGGEVCHIASREHPHTPAWPGSATTTLHRVDSSRNDLFLHRRTRQLALTFLRDAAGATGLDARNRREART